MPNITEKQIGLAFDMNGCPNRCRHCWLGPGSTQNLSESDMRWGVKKFRDYFNQSDSHIETISVATWFREPDYADNYRQLFALESELSDGEPSRYELLSIWRLAHDRTYAKWAKSVGPDTCQISFFGMKDTTDWFYRRHGAFEDAVSATERLLIAGIKPRWQVFLTTKLLPEITDFIQLTERLCLKQRVWDLGAGDFQIFLHLPGPDYEGRKIEDYRPSLSQVSQLPDEIMDPTRKHFQKNKLWYSETELCTEILSEPNLTGKNNSKPEELWFFICSNWDVFSNLGTLEKWWCLGNLKQDRIENIVGNYKGNRNLGLETMYYQSSQSLVSMYGNPEGQKIYSNKESLLSLYRARYCEEEIKKR